MIHHSSVTVYKQPFYKAFANAFNGLKAFLKKERNGKIQAGAAIITVLIGLTLHISATEWVIILICIAAVLATEMINSSLEHLCNLVHNEYHPSIKTIKDMAAGAVLLVSLTSLVVGAIIFGPKIFALL